MSVYIILYVYITFYILPDEYQCIQLADNLIYFPIKDENQPLTFLILTLTIEFITWNN